MSQVLLATAALTALSVSSSSLGLASRLGALVGASRTSLPRPEDERHDREGSANSIGRDSLPKSLLATFGATAAAAVLLKGGDMIETGARTSWSLGGDNTPRALVDLSTVMKFLAGISVGWQVTRLVRGFCRWDEASEPSGDHRQDAFEPRPLHTDGQSTAAPEADEALLRSTGAGLTLALLGGGVMGLLYFRSNEDSFDDVLWNSRLNVGATLLTGASLGVALRTGKALLS
ncbi:conserved hypothetical protein [Neospora caninum Liverpool]|uniref:Transmembrane protein n=1 Tax=Neospora caninum (strain Liverpool) TaxID=572307 RepID=F0VF90_NEOCL|nr:conserved hypothetical protein [Neospora caninum Liverpool]CBZ52384.1 conserved hypothetical protein [Neospora caninum Liverpool]CEL66355.1 TPA: hypothetical protein BN1204_021730 [Neospora caninum Liverpool]|eukprot:XP_003882416.1 conserved hypothetical protein [Neospora caninum Liverpool]